MVNDVKGQFQANVLEMERAHNVKLLERTSRNVVLTGPGEILMSYVERMVALAEEAEISLKSTVGLKTGRIEIGASRPVASAYLSAISANNLAISQPAVTRRIVGGRPHRTRAIG
ncbi:MAG TPA: hypothetical protein VLJ79_11170 [Candidatus Binatia bacterium]|jgi:DNA-binding transcriptional LysR family regulator|nr:hypothetical protein [Candidatus Binatia bacterium]